MNTLQEQDFNRTRTVQAGAEIAKYAEIFFIKLFCSLCVPRVENMFLQDGYEFYYGEKEL